MHICRIPRLSILCPRNEVMEALDYKLKLKYTEHSKWELTNLKQWKFWRQYLCPWQTAYFSLMERFCLRVCMLNEGRGCGGRLMGCALKWRARGGMKGQPSDQRSKFMAWWIHHATGLHLKCTLPQRVVQGFSEEKCKWGRGVRGSNVRSNSSFVVT